MLVKSAPRVLREVIVNDVLDPVHHEVITQPLCEVGGVRVTDTIEKRHRMSENQTKGLLLLLERQNYYSLICSNDHLRQLLIIWF